MSPETVTITILAKEVGMSVCLHALPLKGYNTFTIDRKIKQVFFTLKPDSTCEVLGLFLKRFPNGLRLEARFSSNIGSVLYNNVEALDVDEVLQSGAVMYGFLIA